MRGYGSGSCRAFKSLAFGSSASDEQGIGSAKISEISTSMSAQANLLGFRKIPSLSVFSDVCLLAALANLGDVAPHIGP